MADTNTTKGSKMQKGAGIASGVVGGLTSIVGNLSGGDEIEQVGDAQVNQARGASSKSALSSWLADWTPQSNESMGLTGLSGALSGASAGAAAGPWGALAGAVGGLATGLFGASSRNAERDAANKAVVDAAIAQNNVLSQREAMSALSNYAAFGGWVPGNGGDYSNGLVSFNTGNSHEANPNGGVPQGIGPNGKQNLVEQGETRWDDYVFSDRLKIPKGFDKEYLIGNLKNKTYADASKLLSKESKERPFDTISKNGRDAMLGRLRGAQEDQKLIDSADAAMNEIFELNELGDVIYAEGGGIHIKPSKRGTFTAAAKKHGKSVQGFASQVLANKSNYSPAMVKKANFAKNASKWNHALGGNLFALGDDIKTNWMVGVDGTRYSAGTRDGIGPKVDYSPIGGVRFNVNTSLGNSTPINRVNYDSIISPELLSTITNGLNRPNEIKTQKLTQIPTTKNRGIEGNNSSKSGIGNAGLFAPAAANFGQLISDIVSKPEVAKFGRMDLSDYRQRRHLPYEPIDREYLANKYRAQAGATARQIVDNSAGNASAARSALVAHNYNTLGALGDMYIKADETNRQRKKESIMFDSAQDRQLADLASREQQFNLGLDMQEYDMNARNRAARRSGIRQGVNTVAGNIAEATRYGLNNEMLEKIYGYDTQGNYVRAEGGFLFDPKIKKFLTEVKKGGK